MRRCAVALLAAASLLAGCAGTLSEWELGRARRHLEAGRPDRALGLTERALARHRERAEPRELELHVEALYALGRRAEAEAFADYAKRRAAGVELDSDELEASRAECTRGQEGAELIKEWGHDAPRLRDLGAVAARFQIEPSGAIDEIRILRARDPSAAWWIIEAIARARLSPNRLTNRRQSASESFPVRLCAWWEMGDPASREVKIPEGGCIRGFCTHAPGTAPHM